MSICLNFFADLIRAIGIRPFVAVSLQCMNQFMSQRRAKLFSCEAFFELVLTNINVRTIFRMLIISQGSGTINGTTLATNGRNFALFVPFAFVPEYPNGRIFLGKLTNPIPACRNTSFVFFCRYRQSKVVPVVDGIVLGKSIQISSTHFLNGIRGQPPSQQRVVEPMSVVIESENRLKRAR